MRMSADSLFRNVVSDDCDALTLRRAFDEAMLVMMCAVMLKILEYSGAMTFVELLSAFC